MMQRGRLLTVLSSLPVLLGLWALGLFGWITLHRVGYPYELEWMEGAMLHQVVRVLDGAPLYGTATLDFIPALYMPLYYFVCAAVTDVFGIQLFSLRLVSLVATLLLMLVLAQTARKATHSWLAAVLAPLLFVSLFRYTAFWFDVARVDSLWTLLLLCAAAPLVSFLRTGHRRWLCVSMCAWGMAFLAKQASVFLLPCLVLVVWCWGSVRLAVLYAASAAVVALLLVYGLWHSWGDDFLFYTLQMASTHGVTAYGFERFFRDVFSSVPVMLVLAVSGIVLMPASQRVRCGWGVLLAGFVGLSMLSRAYAGAFFNVMMPLYAALALVAACAVVWWRQYVADRGGMPYVWAAILLCGLSVELLRSNVYDPARQIPSIESRNVTQALVERLAASPGKVCVVAHGYLGYLAGKGFCAHNTQVTDLVLGSDPARAQQFMANTRTSLLRGDYTVLVLDREKELHDLGVTMADIPYDASVIDYSNGKMQFVVNGNGPRWWLQFNPAKAAVLAGEH